MSAWGDSWGDAWGDAWENRPSTAVGVSRSASWRVNVLAGLEQSTEWDVEEVTEVVCPDDNRCGPFLQIMTDFMVEGESRITWSLREALPAPTPYRFQLQVGETGNPLANDWANVGPEIVNGFTATDSSRRALGKQLTVHYRVVMTDADNNVYISSPASVLGNLNFRYWIVVRDIVRQENLKFRQGPGGLKGFLLKRKRSGEKCTRCLDLYTGEVRDSKCSVCHGARFIDGYYRAMPCHFTDPTNVKIEEQRKEGPAGWTADTVVRGRFIASPMLATGDVWVDGSSDLRFYVGAVEVENRVQGVPVTLMCDLYQLPFANEVYKIALE